MNIEIYEDTYNIAVNQYLSRKTAGSKRRKEAFRSKKRRSRVLRDKYGFIADGKMLSKLGKSYYNGHAQCEEWRNRCVAKRKSNIGRINTIVGDDDDYVEKGFSGSKVQRVRSCKGIIPDMPYSELRKALKDKRTSNIPQRIVDGILLQTVSNTVYWICPGEVEVQQDNDDGTGWF